MNIRDVIQQEVDRWQSVGYHALLQRFVLGLGREFQPVPRIGRRMKAKQCFMNATRVAMQSGFEYVEGYVLSEDVPLLIHHAWVSPDGETAMDPTLDSEGRQYFGVSFPVEELCRESARNGVYGLLDLGLGLNARLMFEKMPSLKSLVNEEGRM